VRSRTPGDPVFVDARVRDQAGHPVAGAEVDIWQASGEGYYENQDPQQGDMNLRGKFVTDGEGHIRFRTIKPSGYPIPVSGPVGALLRAQGRHNMRPAHIHFMIRKPGFKTQFSQLYSNDDPFLETDVQFGVTRALVGRYVPHDGAAPDCRRAGSLVFAGTRIRHLRRRRLLAAAAHHRENRGPTPAARGAATKQGSKLK